MEEEINKSRNMSNEYLSEKFATGYQKTLQSELKMQEAFVSECLQKIFQCGRISGTKLLDFGSGPTIHRIAAASAYFSDITLAEWSEANRKELKKWLRGDEDALDWTPSLEQCAGAEGYRDLDARVAEIGDRLRKAVKKIVPCDVLSEDILPNETEEYDVITSHYCFESCCISLDLYKEALRKLTRYLKKGGFLVMTTVLESDEYNAHKTLSCLHLTEEMIKEALVKAGMELRDWFVWRDTKSYEEFKYGGVAVYYAVKV